MYKLEDEITFGQYSKKKGYHKNLTIQEIIDLDPEYLIWACDNVKWFELHHRAMEALLNATINPDEWKYVSKDNFFDDSEFLIPEQWQ